MAEIDFSEKPFSGWLEEIIRDMYDVEPLAIQLQMIDSGGKVYTCYWNVSEDDRAIMSDALRNDAMFAFIRDNKEEILEILHAEDDDDGDGEDE